ncbi:MAG: Lrp/AsnC family transcriptional regulator, partial [Dehalococcoidia bacterium]|nr:Lrp/AsnC family transcriptional regulator [Dehalococcoidia bacterium]
MSELAMIDAIDEQLVRLLQKDCRQSSQALAKKLHISSRTVRRRMNNLLESKVISNVVLVDPVAFGYPVVAIIAFNVMPGKVRSVTEALAARHEVRWLTSTAGRYDILALARFRSTDEASDFLEEQLSKVDGIKTSETFFCLSVKKGRYMQI